MSIAYARGFSNNGLRVCLRALTLGYLIEHVRDVETQVVVAKRIGDGNLIVFNSFIVEEVDTLQIVEIVLRRIEGV